MSSIKSLTQEWMNLVLSKPSMSTKISADSEKLRVPQSDQLKYERHHHPTRFSLDCVLSLNPEGKRPNL